MEKYGLSHAIIITGGNLLTRREKADRILTDWRVSDFDRITIDAEAAIGIAGVKAGLDRLKLKPYDSPVSAIVVPDAARLTVEAQQALLITLEEPPPAGRFILLTQTESRLLPTIISRSQIIRLLQVPEKNTGPATLETLALLLKSTPGKKMQILEPYAVSRQKALEFTVSLQETLLEAAVNKDAGFSVPREIFVSLAENSLRAVSMLDANVLPAACLDAIFIDLPYRK